MPETLILELLNTFSSPGDLVLDTFAGSMSVLRGCFIAQRRYIGCEKSEVHYNAGVTYTWEWAKND